MSLRHFVRTKLGPSANNLEAFIEAIEADDIDGVTKLIAEDGDNVKLDTLLLLATWKGALSVVKWLIASGKANVNASDGVGRSCLHLAAINGKLAVSEALLEAGESNIE